MKSHSTIRYWICYLLLFVVLLALFVGTLCTGSVPFSLSEIGSVLMHPEQNTTAWKILWEIRMPRSLTAIILGGALSVSGFLLQTFFSNPIAGPYILGISSGAKLTVALAMIFFLGQGRLLSAMALIGVAFFGSMLSMGFILLISGKVHRMSILIICGVMIGYICSAITDFVVTFADDSNIVNLVYGQLCKLQLARPSCHEHRCISGIDWDIFSVKANGSISVGRSLRTKPRRSNSFVSGHIDFIIQSAFCVCHGIRWTNFFCWNCCSTSDEEPASNCKTTLVDSSLFFWRRSILPALRLDCKNGFFSDRIEYQHGNGCIWCTHCHLDDAASREAIGGTLP